MPTLAEMASARLTAREPYGPTASAAIKTPEQVSAALGSPAAYGTDASAALAAKTPSYAEYDSANLGMGGGLSPAMRDRGQSILDAIAAYVAPTVMSSPPTVAKGTDWANSTINGATTAAPNHVINDTAKFARVGPLGVSATSYYRPAYATWSGARTQGGTYVYRFKNTANYTAIDICFRAQPGPAPFMLKVGGQWISADNVAPSGINGDNYVKMTFGSAVPANTEHELVIGGAYFISGMNINAGSIVASTRSLPVGELWGDSYYAGAYTGAPDHNDSFGYRAAERMGLAGLLQGRGGQGYVTQVDSRTINQRMVLDAGFALTDPAIVVMSNSVNDWTQIAATVAANMVAGLKHLKATYPNSWIVCGVGFDKASNGFAAGALDTILAAVSAEDDYRTIIIDGRSWPKIATSGTLPDGLAKDSADGVHPGPNECNYLVNQIVIGIEAGLTEKLGLGTLLGDKQALTANGFTAWAGPWSTDPPDGANQDYVRPADYEDTIRAIPAALPNRTRIRSRWPSPGRGGVCGYMHVAYGNYDGSGANGVTPWQVGNITAFTETFDLALSGDVNDANILKEFYLTNTSGNPNDKAYEVGWLTHAADTAKTWIATKTLIGTYTDPQGRAWKVYNAGNEHGLAIYLPLILDSGGDLLKGTINPKHLLDWLMAQGLNLNHLWVNGCGLGLEPYRGRQVLDIDQYAVTFTGSGSVIRPNLLNNGNFGGGTANWNEFGYSGKYVSGGVANFNNSGGVGTTSPYDGFDQNVTFVPNKYYELTYAVTRISGTVRARFMGGTDSYYGEVSASGPVAASRIQAKTGNNKFSVIPSDANFQGSVDDFVLTGPYDTATVGGA